MPKFLFVITMFVLSLGILTSQAHSGWNPLAKEKAEDQDVSNKAAQTIANFKNKDPQMGVFFDKAYGFAVFPTVGKAGMGIGGAFGKGEVYKKGELIGTTSVTQLSFGFQLGGQAYSEIVFFKDKDTLKNFTAGNFEFGAQVSAVAVTAGASADAAYSDGVAIFTMTKGGLMYEAAVSGQKFSFNPM